jgi:hypothetical protein
LTPEQVFDTFGAMRSPEEYARVMSLIAEGHNNSEISRMTGISRTTIREWRVGNGHRHRTGDAGPPGRCDGSCSTVDHATTLGDIYAYLLGQYLGDGMLSEHRRHVYRLRVACTAIYPEIINEVVGATASIRGSDRIGIVDFGGHLDEVSSYWKHWICAFPQHGPGPKWKRPIELATWQEKIVDAHPWMFLRGLIHSDGCRHINTVRRPVGGKIKTYEYSRYMFTNASAAIRDMFTETCDQVGVHWTRTNQRVIAVSRRADVAAMDRFIGPKR